MGHSKESYSKWCITCWPTKKDARFIFGGNSFCEVHFVENKAYIKSCIKAEEKKERRRGK